MFVKFNQMVKWRSGLCGALFNCRIPMKLEEVYKMTIQQNILNALRVSVFFGEYLCVRVVFLEEILNFEMRM